MNAREFFLTHPPVEDTRMEIAQNIERHEREGHHHTPLTALAMRIAEAGGDGLRSLVTAYEGAKEYGMPDDLAYQQMLVEKGAAIDVGAVYLGATIALCDGVLTDGLYDTPRFVAHARHYLAGTPLWIPRPQEVQSGSEAIPVQVPREIQEMAEKDPSLFFFLEDPDLFLEDVRDFLMGEKVFDATLLHLARHVGQRFHYRELARLVVDGTS